MKGKKNNRKVLTLVCILAIIITTVIIPGSVAAYGPLTMYTPPSDVPKPGCLYAKAIQLKNSGSYNGRMYATFEQSSNGTPVFPIYESTNNGQSWTKISEVADTQNGWGMRMQPCLYELPQAIGSLAAGTILCAGNSVPGDLNSTKIDIYKSTNHGQSWSFLSSVASGGRADPAGLYDPVWEPWLMVANDKLICFYADERDAGHSQKIVHQTTTNGTSWSSVVEDVALSTSTYRPGMPVVAQMADGNYIMSYEIFNKSGNPSNFKTSSNPESWNASSEGTTIVSGGTPFVAVMPGGEIVMTNYNSSNIYVNTNNGSGAWTAVSTPVGRGYQRGLTPLSNGRLFIISAGLGGTTMGKVEYGDMSLTTGGGIVSGGTYKLINVNSGKALDVYEASTIDGADVCQWTYSGSNNQKWVITDVGSGQYKIICVNSNKALDVYQASTIDGANVCQWSYSGSGNQKWTITDAGGGYYKIINVNSGKALDVYEASTIDGADVCQWTYSGSNNQKWQLVQQ